MNISTLEIYTKNYYVFCTILSKFILLCFIIFACIFKRHFYDSLTMKNGWAILLLCLTIEYTIENYRLIMKRDYNMSLSFKKIILVKKIIVK